MASSANKPADNSVSLGSQAIVSIHNQADVDRAGSLSNGAIFWNEDQSAPFINVNGTLFEVGRAAGDYYSVLNLVNPLDLSTLTVGNTFVVTVDPDLDWQQGDRAIFEHSRTEYFSGIVNAYNSTSGSLSIDIDGVTTSATDPSYRVFIVDLFNHVGVDSGNLSVIGRFNNYDALVTAHPTASISTLAYVNDAQGTQWLPGSLGGSYRPRGYYIYVADTDPDTGGTTPGWISDRNQIARALSIVYGNEVLEGSYNASGGSITIPKQDSTNIVLGGLDQVGVVRITGTPQAVPFRSIAWLSATESYVNDTGISVSNVTTGTTFGTGWLRLGDGGSSFEGDAVVTDPSGSQTITQGSGTVLNVRGSFDLETNTGEKALDFSGTSGDIHFEDFNTTTNENNTKVLFDRSAGQLYMNPTSTTLNLPTTDDNKIMRAGGLAIGATSIGHADHSDNNEEAIIEIGYENVEVSVLPLNVETGDGDAAETFIKRNTNGEIIFSLSNTIQANDLRPPTSATVHSAINGISSGITKVADLSSTTLPSPAEGDVVYLTADWTDTSGAEDVKYYEGLFTYDGSLWVGKLNLPIIASGYPSGTYDASVPFLNDSTMLIEDITNIGIHRVGNVFENVGNWKNLTSDNLKTVIDVNSGNDSGDVDFYDTDGEVVMHLDSSGKKMYYGSNINTTSLNANDEIATLGDITGTGASLEERFVPNGDNLFTIGNLHTGAAGTAPANSLYFRTSSTDNTKLTITDFSQLVSGNQILFDLPDGSANDGPGNATLTALQNGGTLFISSGTASAEIQIVGIAGDPAVAGGNKRFTLGSVTKSTGTVGTAASTSFSMSTTARSDFYSDGDLVSFIPSSDNLEGLRLGTSANANANRADIFLGFGNPIASTVELANSDIAFTVINHDSTANDQYIHMIGGGGDLGFDVTGLDTAIEGIETQISEIYSILDGGSTGSNIELPTDTFAGVTNVIRDTAAFSSETGTQSGAYPGTGTVSPKFETDTSRMFLCYRNIDSTDLAQLRDLIGRDIAFRNTAAGAVTAGNVEDNDTFHLKVTKIGYRSGSAADGTGVYQVNFQHRDADRNAAFVTAFSWQADPGDPQDPSVDFYLPTLNSGSTTPQNLVSNLIANTVVVEYVPVPGGGSTIQVNDTGFNAVNFKTDTSGDTTSVRGVTFAATSAGVVTGSVDVSGIGSGAQGNSVTVENVQSGANPGDESTFDLQIVDSSGADVGSPTEITIQPGVAGAQGFQGFSTVFAFGFALTDSDTATIAPTGGTGITIPPNGQGVSNGTGVNNRWSFAPVDTNNNPNPATFSIWVVPGTFNPATNNILWGTPFIASGEAGQPGGLGPAGPGVAAAGTTNQLLVKLDDATDTFNTGWTSDITINNLNGISAYKALIPTILLGTRGVKSSPTTVQGVNDVTIQSFTRGTQTNYLFNGIVVVDETANTFTYAAGRALVADSNDLTTATNIANLIG